MTGEANENNGVGRREDSIRGRGGASNIYCSPFHCYIFSLFSFIAVEQT